MTFAFYLFIWFWILHGIKENLCFNLHILIKMHPSGAL